MNSDKKAIKRIIFGPIGLRFFLFCYTLVFLLALNFLSINRNGENELVEERFAIIIICLVLFEILNQITFRLSRNNPELAKKVKCISFWFIFTAGCLSYLYFLLNLEINPTWKLSTEFGYFIIYLVFSIILPQYSLATNIRFLFLRDSFRPR